MILCMCPMCQLNMDGYQSRVNGHFNTQFNLPILYFTQILGIAFGLDPKKLGFGKELMITGLMTCQLVAPFRSADPSGRWDGAMAAMAGAAWVLHVNRYIGGAYRVNAVEGQKVVTGGPYALVRHPL